MQTVSISSPMLDITMQPVVFVNQKKLHKFKARDTEGHVLLKDRILEPINWKRKNNACHNESQIQIKAVWKLTCTRSHLPIVPSAHYKYCMQLQLQSLKD